MPNADDRPPAPPDRERDARELFPLDMTPEEYAARHGHDWYCFSFDDYRYSDPALDRWIQRLGDILRKTPSPACGERVPRSAG